MRRALPSIDTLVAGIRAGNRVLLAQAITLVESAKPEHQALAHEIINRLLQDAPSSNDTFRIGITGAPGAGKSTFIEALGMRLIAQKHRVAVLAIDPTSALSKGSILGDKTRMEHLSASEDAFIRPSPSGNSLGGVARKTRETILLAEAAGFDTVIVETVGVGQSETAVHSMTDLFLLLLLPGAGDELQGIKRGIVEMADIVAVNKADGDRVKLANQARAHYINALHLFPAKTSGWTPQVLTCSALDQRGIDELWDAAIAYKTFTRNNVFFEENRRQQALFWFREALQSDLLDAFYRHPEVRAALQQYQTQVLEGRISPFAAAAAVLKYWS
ncbi:MAG: methylmalonyl Co-A mutase-associated GTPase MeaB [Bacteroidota bacterium]